MILTAFFPLLVALLSVLADAANSIAVGGAGNASIFEPGSLALLCSGLAVAVLALLGLTSSFAMC